MRDVTIASGDDRLVCPNCGNDYQDGRGSFQRRTARIRAESTDRVVERWDRFGCPDCATTFAVLADETVHDLG